MDDARAKRGEEDLTIGATSDLMLLAIALARDATDLRRSEVAVRRSTQRLGSPEALFSASPEEIAHVTQADPFSVRRFDAVRELARRFGSDFRPPPETVDSPQDAYELVRYLERERQEHFVAILLRSDGTVIRAATVHIGTLTASLVGTRELFSVALREGASSVVVAHNHPSGDPTPTAEDIEVTKKIIEAGDLLDIPVLDHIVVGQGYGISLKEGVELRSPRKPFG